MKRRRSDAEILRAAIAPYLSLPRLRYLIARAPESIEDALLVDAPPPDIQAMLKVLSVLLVPPPSMPIYTPEDIAVPLLLDMGHLVQEQLRVICLSAQHHVQVMQIVYQGTLTESTTRGCELFREAMRRNSASIIVAHNHPSGDPSPSPQDVSFTEQMIRAGNLLNINVLDHLIIGRGQWLSMRTEQIAFRDMSVW